MQKLSQGNSNIRILSWFNFFTDFKLYAPVAIIYFANVTGSYALGMSIFSIIMLAAAIFEVPTGIFSDLIGRKKTVLLGALASTAAVTLYAIGGTYWVLVLGAACEGVSCAFYSGNNDALLFDTLTMTSQESEYLVFLGKTSAMFQVALGISAVFGGIIANSSFTLVMWFSVIPQIACVLLSTRLKESSQPRHNSTNVFSHTKEALQHFTRNPKLRLLSMASILNYALGESSYQFRAAFLGLLWPLWALGFSKVFSNLSAAVSYYWSGNIIKRFTESKILLLQSLYGRMMGLVALVFPFVGSPLLLSTTSLFFGVGEVACDNLMQKEYTHQQRATMSSLNSLAGSIGFALVSFGLGLLADGLGIIKALLALEIVSFSIAWLYWKFLVRYS